MTSVAAAGDGGGRGLFLDPGARAPAGGAADLRPRALLGRPWEIEGRVEHGDKRGRELGFPTANHRCSGEYLQPAHGIYAVKAGIDEGRGTALA